MEEAGVIAVVKELSSFMSDMKQMNSAIDGLRSPGTLLGSMFEFLGSTVQAFGQAVWDVASVTLGVLLRDAIEYIIGKLGDLINATIEAGNTFQMLQIRLTGLNLNEVSDGVKSYSQAMSEAVQLTKEQLQWLQTFGVASPFDPAMIANVYTLARSYGFADQEAKRLTEDTLNYTAGMGLSNETLELVIRNMGQMVQRGKITSTELRDLARGSYMPLADLMERIAKNMGITVEELSKQIVTPEGVPAKEFILAFEQMVEEEPRFVGAAGRLARALIPAVNNVKELITSIFGLNVVAPIFEVLGEYVASFVDQFVYFNEQGDLIKTEKWDQLVFAAKRLGAAIMSVIAGILGFMPTSESLADNLINAVSGLAEYIENNREAIIQFFKDLWTNIVAGASFVWNVLIPALGGIVTWVWNNKDAIWGFFTSIGEIIVNTVVPFITGVLMPAFQQIADWVTANKPTIDAFFETIGNILSGLTTDLFGAGKEGEGAAQGPLAVILATITAFMNFVIAHPTEIKNLIEAIIALIAVFTILQFVLGIVVGFFGLVFGIIMSVVGAFLALGAIILFLGTPLGIVTMALVGFALIVATLAIIIIAKWNEIKAITELFVTFLVLLFNTLGARLETEVAKIGTSILKHFNQMVDNIKAIGWLDIGKFIMSGIAAGITMGASSLISAAVSAARQAYDAAMNFLQAGSPSKLFMELGEWTMLGMAQGIENYASRVAATMTDAMQTVAAPAMIMPVLAGSLASSGGYVSNNSEQNNNFNLAIHSSANTEPIINDFNMMKSLVGG